MFNTTSPIHSAFVPLYALLANDKPKEGITKEWLQIDYSRRVKENKKPNWFKKRSLTEIIGGVLGIGGILTWIFSYAKESKVGKWLSGIVTVGGIAAIITGLLNIIELKAASTPNERGQSSQTDNLLGLLPSIEDLFPTKRSDQLDGAGKLRP